MADPEEDGVTASGETWPGGGETCGARAIWSRNADGISPLTAWLACAEFVGVERRSDAA